MNRIVVCVTVVFVEATVWAVGTLQIGEPKVEQNQVIVPVILGGDVAKGVSTLDFRLNYNPEALKPVSASAGDSASRADKQVMGNASAAGQYNVVMMGMNQTTCQSGEVVRLTLEQVTNAPAKQWGLGLSDQTMSAPDGSMIDSRALPYTATPPTEPTTPDEKPDPEPDPVNPPERPSKSGIPMGPIHPDEAGDDIAVELVADGVTIVAKGGRSAEERAREALDAKDRAQAALRRPVTDADAKSVDNAPDENAPSQVAQSPDGTTASALLAPGSAAERMPALAAVGVAATVEANKTRVSDMPGTETSPGRARWIPWVGVIAVGAVVGAACAIYVRRRTKGRDAQV